ncbi:armadillo-type protein [Mycena maculata]|uniref:Armadillo-type protein n=1 Tax=Mycena maculata TaxID=230809 RepID=A0AAD7MV00_9AGAR|nr:armadillo-type protein [Mycena maculata]
MAHNRPTPLASVDPTRRKATSHLNKLAASNFDSISDQIITMINQSAEEDDSSTLCSFVRLLTETAISQPLRSEMYSRLSRKMMEEISPTVHDNGIKNDKGNAICGGQLFRKYFLSGLQVGFDRGLRLSGTEGTKEAFLGIMRLLSEIFAVRMLTERIMHECIKGCFTSPLASRGAETAIEAFCILMETAGSLLDTPKAIAHIDAYFAHIDDWIRDETIPTRVQFMVQDIADLRTRSWVPLRQSETEYNPQVC